MLRKPRQSANAVITRVLEYVGDPRGEAAQRAINADATRLSRGRGAHALLWEKGAPAVTFGGALPRTPQPIRIGPSGAVPIVTVEGGDVATASRIYDSPSRRIFADRMRRRG
jgi:hypothetical protein